MTVVGIEERAFKSSNEMFDAILSMSRTSWMKHPFLFRGQGCADDSLIPSALRENVDFPQGNGLAESCGKQIIREWGVLDLFTSLADQQGLYIPGLDE